ncbi:MAG: glycoside hydrolase family 97 catalytic domain-containing protein [Bacteroidales bacterium]|nr:glycoside hydrolase family 97 catalytic domain-containing protein [Bacteroidales bacterium]
MNRFFIFFVFAYFIFSVFGLSLQATEMKVISPDKHVVFSLFLKSGILSYSVSLNDSVLIDNSPLGIEREDGTFTQGLSFISSKSDNIDDRYHLKIGKQRDCIATANQTDFIFQNQNGNRVSLQVRAYPLGVAFRYKFPEKSKKKYIIKNEITGFKLPLGGKSWTMPYDSISKFTPGYETYYVDGAPVGTASSTKEGWAFPTLFQVKSKWILITESGLNETYCASHIQPDPKDGLYLIRFPEKDEAMGFYDQLPSSTLPWSTPWRVVILGNSCGEIVESNLVTDLAESSKIKNTEWIKPGKSSWSWWSDHDSPRNFESLKKFVDFSVQMGWEYSLVDANWDIMQGGNVKQLIDYANHKNVGIWLWYNSGGKTNTVTERPRDIMCDSAKRNQEFAKLHNWGVKGVKIDFFQSDKQAIIKLYIDILKDAAKHHIMVNFHGCTLPRGWQRTYPNLLSMESVRGAENYDFDATYPAKAVWHNTIYPFTRNVVGPMDYTPMTLSNMKYPHVTTNGYELALPIVFESGILHFADKIEAYQVLDEECKSFLKRLPTVWDETKFVAGEPGKYVVVARRNGSKWVVAGINGQPFSQKVTISTHNLTKYITDGKGAMNLESRLLHSADNCVEIEMIKYGGFVAY